MQKDKLNNEIADDLIVVEKDSQSYELSPQFRGSITPSTSDNLSLQDINFKGLEAFLSSEDFGQITSTKMICENNGIDSRKNFSLFIPSERIVSVTEDCSLRLNKFRSILGQLSCMEPNSKILLRANVSVKNIEGFISRQDQKGSDLQFDFNRLNTLRDYINSLSDQEKLILKEQLQHRLGQHTSSLKEIKSEQKPEESLGREQPLEEDIEQEFHRLFKETTALFLESLGDITDYNEKYKQLKPNFIKFLSELKEYNKNEDIAELLTEITEFTCKTTSLYFSNMNRVGVAIELLNQFIYPWSVDQKDSNLCGMASVVSIFSVNFPKLFLKSCIQFAESGSIHFPIKLQVTQSQWRDNPTSSLLIPFLMAAMRDHYNISGYSPNCLFERLRGATRPKTIVKILEQANFTEIEEDMVLTNRAGNPISYQYQALLGGVYSKQHLSQSAEQSLAHVVKRVNEGKPAIILISVGIMHYFTGQAEPLTSSYLLNLSFDHFVYLVECQIIDDDVKLKIHTYGEEYEAVIPKNIFLSHFRGSICATVPQLPQAEEACCLESTTTRL